jgi:hypothetical protein
MYSMMLSFLSLSLYANWQFGTIYNNSDLVLNHAWKHRASGASQKLSWLTNVVNKAHKKGRSAVIVDYLIDSKGIALRAWNSQGKEYDIYLDGQVSHSIMWHRSKTNSITNFPQSCDIKDGSYCARALMQDNKVGTVIGSPVAVAHDDEHQFFDLYLEGKNGNYHISLVAENIHNLE